MSLKFTASSIMIIIKAFTPIKRLYFICSVYFARFGFYVGTFALNIRSMYYVCMYLFILYKQSQASCEYYIEEGRQFGWRGPKYDLSEIKEFTLASKYWGPKAFSLKPLARRTRLLCVILYIILYSWADLLLG